MHFPVLILLWLSGGQEPAPPRPDLAAGVAAILTRAEAQPVAAGAGELLALGDVGPLLLEALGTGRAPGDGERLGVEQLALVQAAVAGLGATRLTAFVAAVEREPSSATSVAAALRVLALDPHTGAGPMLALARMAEANSSGAGLEDALDEALVAAFARNARDCVGVAAVWSHLGPLAASGAVRALERTRAPEALACLRTLLGRRAEFDACVLCALANLVWLVPHAGAEGLADEVKLYLKAEDSARAQAAATVLGRLGVPSSVPSLIDFLETDDPILTRAVLSALRAIGAVSLPASAAAWRSWYAREESWWRERAPETLAALQPGAEEPSLTQLVVLARTLSEHTLFRDELVPALVPLLSRRDAGARILACQALQRLGSRLALPELCARLGDGDRQVATAAHDALVALAGVDLPAKRAVWWDWLTSEAQLPAPALGLVPLAR